MKHPYHDSTQYLEDTQHWECTERTQELYQQIMSKIQSVFTMKANLVNAVLNWCSLTLEAKIESLRDFMKYKSISGGFKRQALVTSAPQDAPDTLERLAHHEMWYHMRREGRKAFAEWWLPANTSYKPGQFLASPCPTNSDGGKAERDRTLLHSYEWHTPTPTQTPWDVLNCDQLMSSYKGSKHESALQFLRGELIPNESSSASTPEINQLKRITPFSSKHHPTALQRKADCD